MLCDADATSLHVLDEFFHNLRKVVMPLAFTQFAMHGNETGEAVTLMTGVPRIAIDFSMT